MGSALEETSLFHFKIFTGPDQYVHLEDPPAESHRAAQVGWRLFSQVPLPKAGSPTRRCPGLLFGGFYTPRMENLHLPWASFFRV